MRTNMLERNITTMMLGMPQEVAVTRIDPKWFTKADFAVLCKVINNNVDGSIRQWHSKARELYPKYFHLTTDFMYTLQNGMSKYSHLTRRHLTTLFKKDVYDLHMKYIGDRIWYFTNDMRKNGVNNKDIRHINELIQLTGKMESNSSHFDQTQDGYKTFIKRARHEDNVYLQTGFKELDYALGGLDGEFLLDVSAPTGAGKTAFCVNACDNILRSRPNVRIDYFSAEMGAELMLDRFVSHRTGLSDFQLNRPYDRLSSPDNALAQVTMKHVADSGLHIYVGSNLDKIMDTIRVNAMGRKTGTYLAVIDHINIINLPGDENKAESSQIGDITRDLKILSSQLQVPIIMQSQLNRKSQYKDTNKLELQDLKGSSSIEQDSNAVILLYKSDKQPKKMFNNQNKDQNKDMPVNMVANVAKNRSGITEEIPFKFDGSRMLFIEDAKGDNADKVIDSFKDDDARREVTAREDLVKLRNKEKDHQIAKYFKHPKHDDYYKLEKNNLMDKYLDFETKILHKPGFIRPDAYVQCGSIQRRASKLAKQYNRASKTDYDYMNFIRFVPGHALFDQITDKVFKNFVKHYHINFDKISQNNGKQKKQPDKTMPNQDTETNTGDTQSSIIDNDGSQTPDISMKDAQQIIYDLFGAR